MLNPEEVIAIKEHLLGNQERYRAASEHVRTTCLNFKRQHPQVLRVVFEREPPIKTVESVIAKIELVRERYGKPGYDVEDLEDIVALTALCPYETDIQEFIRWMKTAFAVITRDEDAIHESPVSGYWARHYILAAQSGPTTYNFAEIKCELQVKTILQEAFGAKAHDLAYKPKKLKVSEKLNKQFVLMSTSLRALDGQSEFLKDLILSDKQEVALRRDACLLLYLRQERIRTTAEAVGLDVQNLPEVTRLANAIQNWVRENGVSKEICKLAALCAIKRDSDYLRFEAVRFADGLVKQNPAEARRYLIRGSVKWLVGQWEGAIGDIAVVIEKGAKQAEDATVVGESKNNFVYFVSDWKAHVGEEREAFNSAAKIYAEELRADLDGKTTDTVGLYLIAFGETEDEVEQGRVYIRNARKLREEDPTYLNFYRLHEYIALRKLLDMAPRPKVEF